MTFPTVTAGTLHATNSDATSKTVNCPAHSAGDRLVLVMAWDGNPTVNSVSTVGGDSWVQRVHQAASASAAKLAVYEIVSRSSSGASQNVTVTLSATERGGARIFAITGSHASEAMAVALGTGTSTSTPNPPSLDPSGWATEDTLWMAVFGMDGSRIVSAYPTNYSDNQTNGNPGSATTGACLGFATRNLRASSDDPGTFTTDTADDSVAATLAIRPLVPNPAPNQGSVSGSIAWVGSVDGEAPSGGGPTTIFGKDTAGGTTGGPSESTWGGAALIAPSFRYTAEEGDVVVEVGVYGSDTGDCQVAIYEWNGTVPTNRVGSPITVNIGASAAWYTASANIALTAGTTYVVAIDYFITAGWITYYDTIGANTASDGASSLGTTWSQVSTASTADSFYAMVEGVAGPPEGEVTGAIAWVGSVDGTSPAVGANDGAVSGAISWVGSVTGTTVRSGSVSGSIAWVGVVDGDAPTNLAEMTQTRRLSQRVINNGNAGGNGDYTSNSFTTVSGSLLVAVITYDCQSAITTPNYSADIPTPVTSGLTWVKHASIYANRQFTCMAEIWIADNASGGSKTIVQDGTGRWATDTNCIDVNIYEYTDAEIEANQTGATAGRHEASESERDPGAQSLTLSAAPADTSYVLGLGIVDGGQTTSTTVPGSGWTEDVDVTTGGSPGPYMGTQIQWRTDSTSTSVAWNDITQCWDYCLLALEIQAGEATAGPNEGSVSGSISWVGTVLGPISDPFPTTVSGVKLLDQNGNVYLLYSQSSWGLSIESEATITEALDDLVTLGLNGVNVWIGGGSDYGNNWTAYQNRAGQSWWTGTPWASTFGAAWDRVDFLVEEAFNRGLTIMLSLAGGAFSTAEADWVSVTNTNMETVGTTVANRYAAYPNVIWHVMFDDTIPSSVAARVNAYFAGINGVDGTNRPRWVEPNNQTTTYDEVVTPGLMPNLATSALMDGWYDNGWVDSQWANVVDNAQAAYADAITNDVPTGNTEAFYDGSPLIDIGNDGQQLREQLFATFLEGGMYGNFSHERWWVFGDLSTDSWIDSDEDILWQDFVTHDHTLQQSNGFALIKRYVADLTWDPVSTFVTTGVGSGDTKAAQGRSDTAALAYFPSSRTVVVDTTIIPGTAPVRLRWYDPVNFTYTTIAASEAQQTGRSITYPSAHGDGTNDWVLVVDTSTEGSVTGSISWVGSVTGERDPKGSVSGAISWVGSVTGTSDSEGSVSGSISWAGSVTGERDPKGAVSGAISWTGAVTGVRTPKGSVSGSIGWSGVIVGGNLGVVVGSIGWVGSVTGQAPVVGVNDGAVSGAISWVGSVTGEREPDGLVSGSIDWVGNISGESSPEGFVSGSISWVGEVEGLTPGQILEIGFITGDISGPGLTLLIINGVAVRRVMTGPNVSRVVDGAEHVVETIEGPNRNIETIDGPNTSRTITGPDTNRAVTGPES